jgi:hypothetical protein
MEKAHLVGGACDNFILDWNGGDVIQLVDNVFVAPGIMRTGGSPKDEPPPLLYRRSMVTRSIFVFQP